MWYLILMHLACAVGGSFGAAYIHERTGRDVTMGGLLGALVGLVGGPVFTVMFLVWLYYDRQTLPVGRVYNSRRPPWYRWWD